MMMGIGGMGMMGMGSMGGYVSDLITSSRLLGLSIYSAAALSAVTFPSGYITDALQGGLGSGAYGVSSALLTPWLRQLIPRSPWYY
jgi:hypothetical protein